MCFMTQDTVYLVESSMGTWQESVLCCCRESYNYQLDSGQVMSGELQGKMINSQFYGALNSSRL